MGLLSSRKRLGQAVQLVCSRRIYFFGLESWISQRLMVGSGCLIFFPLIALAIRGSYFQYRGSYLSMLFGVYAGIFLFRE